MGNISVSILLIYLLFFIKESTQTGVCDCYNGITKDFSDSLQDHQISTPTPQDLGRSEINAEREMYTSKMLSYMDTTVDPCDDFYQYACGNYFTNQPIKSGYHAIDNWMVVEYEIDKYMHELLNNENSSEFQHSSEVKAKQFYKSCMGTDIFKYDASEVYLKLVEYLGGWPALDPNWDEKNFDWFKTVVVMRSLGVRAIIYEAVDENDPTVKILVSANHFGLIPMNSDDFNFPYTSTYKINKKLSLFMMKQYNISSENAKRAFHEIMEFGKHGTKLFEMFSNRADNKIENITVKELIEKIPEIPYFYWEVYFFNLFKFDFSQNIRVNVDDVHYFKGLINLLINKTEKHVIANYLMLKLVFELHDELNSPKYKSDYCLLETSSYFGPVLDSMFMRSKYRNERSEQEVLSMSSYMKSALQDVIKSSKWLDKDTKHQALKKVKQLYVNVDDVDFSLDIEKIDERFNDLEIEEDEFHENVLAVRNHYSLREHVEFLGETDYYTTDVNAYYLSTKNMVTLPAGIFHKPLYYPELPKAYNFGVMGGKVMGHEIMHAFDPEGIDYDGLGVKRNWLSNESRAIYEDRLECLIDQYNEYKIDEIGENIDGEKSLGENISDNGAIKISYLAYKKWLRTNEGSIDLKRETLPGINLTNTQLFFLSYGQGLCGIYKRKGYKRMTKDVHVIEKWRTIGSLVNFDEFSKEFGCEKNTPMNPEKKCIVW